MIILIAFLMVCFVAYAVWVIDVMANRFSNDALGLLASLLAILMPPSIIAQVLVYTEVIK